LTPRHGERRADGRRYQADTGWVTHEYFEKSRRRRNARKRYVYKRRQHWLRKYKEAKGCQYCGYNENAVALQFDHRNRRSKYQNVSSLICRRLSVLFAEIRKCRILCANCHLIRTHKKVKK